VKEGHALVLAASPALAQLRQLLRTVFLLLLVSSCCGPKPQLTIFAAASLKEVITLIEADFRVKTGEESVLRFDSSSALARQIEEGAPAHIFITAAPQWLEKINTLERFDWLSNRLVCVTRKETSGFDINRIQSLALGNETVPVGAYARAALKHMGVRVPERTIYGANAREVLSRVVEGGADAGIVYATDAGVEPRVKVAFVFAEESHPKIIYSAGLLKEEGRAFFETLKTKEAKQAAQSRGFEIAHP